MKIFVGVYQIKNLLDQRIYIGSSINIKKHWTRHKANLRKHTHSNTQLQESWNTYGESNFGFSIQELCAEADLLSRETYWVTHYDSMNSDKGFNCVLPTDPRCHRPIKVIPYRPLKPRERKRKDPKDIIPYTLRKLNRHAIILKSVSTGLETTYPSIKEAVRWFSLVPTNVYNCLDNPFKKYKHRGFYFKRI